MSEQKQGDFNFDELFQGGGLDLGGAQSDYDPFAQVDNLFPNQPPDEPDEQEEPDDGDEPEYPDDPDNVTELPTYKPQEQDAVSKQPEINPPEKPTTKVVTPDFNPLAAAVNWAEEQNVKAGAAARGYYDGAAHRSNRVWDRLFVLCYECAQAADGGQ